MQQDQQDLEEQRERKDLPVDLRVPLAHAVLEEQRELLVPLARLVQRVREQPAQQAPQAQMELPERPDPLDQQELVSLARLVQREILVLKELLALLAQRVPVQQVPLEQPARQVLVVPMA